MIISASRRTDIPAFYSSWFMERVRAGFYIKVNPFNAKQKKIVSIKKEDVDAIVFWTKNPKPIMKHLDELNEMGYNYYFQFTINDYPKQLEPSLPSLEQRLNIFKELSETIGKDRVIWRFDPIIYSSITPISNLVQQFQTIAGELHSHTNRVVISFVDMYGKTKNKFLKLEKEFGINFYHLVEAEYRSELIYLSKQLSSIAKSKNLAIYTCAEKLNLDHLGIKHGACIDRQLINELFQLSLETKKDVNQRSECMCAVSEEMGSYDTCKFNCTYCYAIQSEKAVRNATQKHNWQSPLLIGEVEKDEQFSEQLKLF